MASGIVAKKIALFEVKPQSFEQQCRLKRKHAIRRKKYRGKERRVVTREGTSMIALSTSDEHLNQLKNSDENISTFLQPCSSHFSASCSALFDLVSAESFSESGVTVDDTTQLEIVPKSKRVILKSAALENFSKRLNIIDIDIEIKIEKKDQRGSSPSVDVLSSSEEYEPLSELDATNAPATSGAPVAVSTERIRLKASLDDSKTETNVNYYCLNCSHNSSNKPPINKRSNNNNCTNKPTGIDANSSSSPEPLYENIFTSAPPPPMSLGAPPLPPKRLFGDSFTTNYSCLPAVYSREKRKAQFNQCNSKTSNNDKKNKTKASNPNKTDATETDASIIKEKDEEEFKSVVGDNTAVVLTVTGTTSNGPCSNEEIKNADHVTDFSSNPLLLTTGKKDNVADSSAIATCLQNDCNNETVENGDKEEGEDEEPFYEDLYDYCNGSENGNAALINPLLELFRDQLNSLEQNVEDEVEYCDCSTILAMNYATSIANTVNDGSLQEMLLEGEAASSEKLDDIYDDCYGVEAIYPTNICTNSKNNKTKCYNMSPNCGTEYEAKDGHNNPSKTNVTSTPSHTVNEYVKAKVTNKTAPGWQKLTSSHIRNGAAASSTKKAISSASPCPIASASSNLLSVFPSLSTPKTKLEHLQHLKRDEMSEERIQNGTSAQVIAENERNVYKKNVNPYAYETQYAGSDNGKSKTNPRFGGRPVIAHPVQCDVDFTADDQERNNEDQFHPTEQLVRTRNNKRDDNEIFNKPLPLPPSNASTYESLYEEPIYGITNQLTATYSDGGKPSVASPGKRRSSAPAAAFTTNKLTTTNSKTGSVYSHSPSVSSGSTYGYSSGSVNEYGESGSASKYGPSSCQTVGSSSSTSASATTTTTDSIYGVSDKLPPTPPSKFSSIAKTAGRKIAKKIMGMRKTSKCGLEEWPAFGINTNESTNAMTNDSVSSKGSNLVVTNTNGKISNSNNSSIGGGGGAQIRPIRPPISRPSIPPPEPPECATVPALPDSVSNYSIYDKKNEDDYDDSDFYDSDSELIRNFVSQVQPIYSMEEEPLYQYYTYGISLKPDDDYQPVIPKNLGLTLDMLVPRVGQRTLWCELPGVVTSGILSILSDKQKQLQEAIFEILTSEVSYLKSLDVLITLFYKNEELIGVLTEEERGYLFGNIEEVRDCSQAFLSELLGKWEESWYLELCGEIIARNTETRFSVYKEYCRNKPYQDKTMQRLRQTRDEFVSVVKGIEEDAKCQMLQIDSFLMLPMQRITRLPLLVNAVIQRTAAGKEKNKCEEALKCLTNLVLSCNDAARESQDAEETMAILEKLEFTRGIKALPDLGQFIMKGDFMKNPFDQGRGNQINWTFRKAKRTFYWLLLFSKQLLVARRKTNGRYEIIDMIDPLESSIKALPNLEGISKDFKHFFMLHFSRKETVYFLAARTNSEVERWKTKLDAMKPKEELRVEAIFPYEARRPDEMSFYVGDVIRVSQMQPDGWYHGTKLATGESGWFPGNYCCENAA